MGKMARYQPNIRTRSKQSLTDGKGEDCAEEGERYVEGDDLIPQTDIQVAATEGKSEKSAGKKLETRMYLMIPLALIMTPPFFSHIFPMFCVYMWLIAPVLIIITVIV